MPLKISSHKYVFTVFTKTRNGTERNGMERRFKVLKHGTMTRDKILKHGTLKNEILVTKTRNTYSDVKRSLFY